MIRMFKSRIIWLGHTSHTGEKCVQGLGWKTGKRPLGRTRNRFEEKIELHHKEIGRDDMDSIHLAQVKDLWWAFVKNVMSLQIP
jgi:hypothetical protein